RDFQQPLPEGIVFEDIHSNGVAVRVYSAGQPTRTVMYFHGGGFVIGSPDTHHDVCAELCVQTGYRVVSVDYRLSPEFRHPAQFDDCWNATLWTAATYGDPIVLVGDSAGGALAACVAHHARGRLDSLLGQVLIYPVLGDDLTRGSYIEHANAPLLSAEDMGFFMQARSEGEIPQGDPTFLPLQDQDFANIVPTVVFTADCDPLRDDGPDYVERLRDAGCKAQWNNEEGLIHGYIRARASVPRARDSFERISIAIEALGQSIWPYD
ncbi:MAG: alpha/beta hydrolase, partial [Pseudomonadota bacterium]